MVPGIIKQVAGATREKISGKFIDEEGDVVLY
jgi:hypothetical protein